MLNGAVLSGEKKDMLKGITVGKFEFAIYEVSPISRVLAELTIKRG